MMIGPLPVSHGGTAGGGVANRTAAISDRLAQSGLEICVVTNSVAQNVRKIDDNPSVIGIPTPDVLDALGYYASPKHIASLIADYSWQYSRLKASMAKAAFAFVYLRVAKELDVNLIHIHMLGSPLVGAGRVGKELGIPVVATVHSLVGTLGIDYVKNVTVPSLKYADQIITVSESLKTQLKTFSPELRSVTAVRSGVDTTLFFPVDRVEARRQLGLRPDAHHLLFVGNLVPVKACDVLVAAFAKLKNRFPNATLHFIGDRQPYTDPDWFNSLKALPRRLGVQDSVQFHGWVDSDQVDTLRLWYSASDCTVLPSIDEGLGLVLLESMACGTPVIGSSVGGIPEIIETEINGLTVPPGDPNALAGAIERILDDSALRSKVVQNQMATVRELSWDIAADSVSRIYSHALGKR